VRPSFQNNGQLGYGLLHSIRAPYDFVVDYRGAQASVAVKGARQNCIREVTMARNGELYEGDGYTLLSIQRLIGGAQWNAARALRMELRRRHGSVARQC